MCQQSLSGLSPFGAGPSGPSLFLGLGTPTFGVPTHRSPSGLHTTEPCFFFFRCFVLSLFHVFQVLNFCFLGSANLVVISCVRSCVKVQLCHYCDIQWILCFLTFLKPSSLCVGWPQRAREGSVPNGSPESVFTSNPVFCGSQQGSTLN